jgi:hypothetical protein
MGESHCVQDNTPGLESLLMDFSSGDIEFENDLLTDASFSDSESSSDDSPADPFAPIWPVSTDVTEIRTRDSLPSP